MHNDPYTLPFLYWTGVDEISMIYFIIMLTCALIYDLIGVSLKKGWVEI